MQGCKKYKGEGKGGMAKRRGEGKGRDWGKGREASLGKNIKLVEGKGKG